MAINRKEAYQLHRENFFKKLPNNSMAIIANPPAKIRNEDVEYEYRSDSNFQYLTDFPEAETVAVFIKQGEVQKYYLFCLPKDPAQETWTGKRIGTLAAIATYGADEAYDLAELPNKMATWLKQSSPTVWMLHTEDNQPVEIYARLAKLCAQAKVRFPKLTQVQDLTPALQALRDVKDTYELERMRKAASVSMEGHFNAWDALQPSINEKNIQVELMRIFLLHGNQHGLAYPCIVAGGDRANTLHYESNDQDFQDGELVLIDAAAEMPEGYASDITRTVPVNGKFTPAQAIVYERVLAIQKELIAMCVPGVNFYDIQKAMINSTTQVLIDLGVLQGELDALIEQKAYKKYIPHGFGHWIGLDVHDPMPYDHDPADQPLVARVESLPWLNNLIAYVRKAVEQLYTALLKLLNITPAAKPKIEPKGRVLKENHVLTVEPGLYFAAEDMAVPEAYRGIGIRIEDVIRVRANEGPEILTAALPKDIKRIEEMMQKPSEEANNGAACWLRSTKL